MAENSGDLSLGYMMGQDSNGGGGGGMFGGDGWWGIILLALLFGWGGFGGNRGGGGGGGNDPVSQGFALNSLENGIRGIQQGLCDGFYAVNTGLLTGFNGIQSQLASCCCETQRNIDGVRYDMATGFCNLGNTIQSTTRDVIDNQNANYRGIMDFLVQSKMDALRSENESLRLRASQADQNAVIRAAIDASTAEIIRRTGNDCPVPSYLVQPPTAVNFPVNSCGTVQFGGNYGNWGGMGRDGCGCGCG